AAVVDEAVERGVIGCMLDVVADVDAAYVAADAPAEGAQPARGAARIGVRRRHAYGERLPHEVEAHARHRPPVDDDRRGGATGGERAQDHETERSGHGSLDALNDRLDTARRIERQGDVNKAAPSSSQPRRSLMSRSWMLALCAVAGGCAATNRATDKMLGYTDHNHFVIEHHDPAHGGRIVGTVCAVDIQLDVRQRAGGLTLVGDAADRHATSEGMHYDGGTHAWVPDAGQHLPILL